MDTALGFEMSFPDLYKHKGLLTLDKSFLAWLAEANHALFVRLQAARARPDQISDREESKLIIALSPWLEDFLTELFPVKSELQRLRDRHHQLGPLYRCKRTFVQRRVAKSRHSMDDLSCSRKEMESLIGSDFDELDFAKAVMQWLGEEDNYRAEIHAAERYAAWAIFTHQGQEFHQASVLFRLPGKLDLRHLVETESERQHGLMCLKAPDHRRRERSGFDLTDRGADLVQALDQAHYCIWCHNQGKDSCSKGLRSGDQFKSNVLGKTLVGCPLEEKISEANWLKSQGQSLGALATIIIDNPMCAATGHRICNDCMLSCIYQKQEPVDVPQIETRILKDVLDLPWGFELYSLLTRWNPLNLRRPVVKAASGYKVLIVGLGPAGFTLAHHLMNDGHSVVAIDGLKIEPLPQDICGVSLSGKRVEFSPIRDVHQLYQRLDERITGGFGGVAEYGITSRWNKNFLTIVRLLLERRPACTMIGGVRFGGTITIDEAFAAGFDHIALCTGAGRPTVLLIPNGLARGVRQASDFLMSLQLTGAAKADSLANLEIRLPIVVIGGGLTAVDAATEALAYYPVQVEKFRHRHQELKVQGLPGQISEQQILSDPADRETICEFLEHAEALRSERELAARQQRPSRCNQMLDDWGGATVAYRRQLLDSPAYILNHQEITNALAEGIRFVENVSPLAVEVDAAGRAKALRVRQPDGSEYSLPARTILVAAGTVPNTTLARECSGSLQLHGKFYQARNEQGQLVTPQPGCKPSQAQVLVALGDSSGSDDASRDNRISFFGDLHPSYSGGVASAMASAKQGYSVVGRAMAAHDPTPVSYAELSERMNLELRTRVHQVIRLTERIVEVIVHAPRAAARFQPGQFYRLQNFETLAKKYRKTSLSMEGIALTGAWVDKEQGLVSLITLEMGGSSDLCALLRTGESLILMGPTGSPTFIPKQETVCLIGGGLGNAVLLSIGQACRQRNNRVIYFAGYRRCGDRYKTSMLERSADSVIWCCEEDILPARRASDRTYRGNLVKALKAYAAGNITPIGITLSEVDRFITVGSDRMMAAVAKTLQADLAAVLKSGYRSIGSINSPMQCMMKEICGQCLQLQRDPLTGEERVVFSCFEQDQSLDKVDFKILDQRLRQNSVHEQLTARWLSSILAEMNGNISQQVTHEDLWIPR